MVLLTAITLVVAGVLGIGAVSATATLAHWISIVGAALVGLGTSYILFARVEEFRSLFEEDVFAVLTAGFLGSVAGFLAFRVFEAVFAAVGWIAALVLVVLIGASIVFSPAVVVGAVKSVILFVVELVGVLRSE